jgi:peptidoglycan/LPS O-acetylase OafA/YrhL
VRLRELNVPRSQLRPLTGLRFIAALQVLVFHCTRWPSWPVHPLLRNIAGSGYVAVSLFFVLSGFILTYAHSGPSARPLERMVFYASRFARIYPAYAFALALVGPFFIVHTIRIDGVVPFLAGAISVPLLVQAWVPTLAMAWNPPAWSLSAEAFFYLLFPLIAPRVVACRRATAVRLGIACYAICLAAPLLYLRLAPDGSTPPSHESTAFWLSALRYNPAIRLPEFVIGILLGRWYLEGHVHRVLGGHAAAWSLLSVSALLLALAEGPHLPYPVVHNGLFAPVMALLIASLAIGRGPVAAFLSTRPMVVLGEASYSLYVLHVPLLIYWSKGVSHVAGEGFRASAWSTAGFLVSAVLASLLCQRYVERPLRDLVLDRLRRARIRPDRAPVADGGR